MSNMGYCRYQNTSKDLQDCIDALENIREDEDGEEGFQNLSYSEKRAAIEMREQCETYIRIYDEVTEADD